MKITRIISNLEPIPQSQKLISFVTSDPQDRINSVYYFDPSSGSFYAKVTFGPKAQGPPGHAHGGAIASILDECMGATAWMNKNIVMTAELKVNYKQALPLGLETYIHSWVDQSEGKKMILKAELFDAQENKYAMAEGLFICQPVERFKAMGVESLEPPFSVA